jgi:hypothetical protein
VCCVGPVKSAEHDTSISRARRESLSPAPVRSGATAGQASPGQCRDDMLESAPRSCAHVHHRVTIACA